MHGGVKRSRRRCRRRAHPMPSSWFGLSAQSNQALHRLRDLNSYQTCLGEIDADLLIVVILTSNTDFDFQVSHAFK